MCKLVGYKKFKSKSGRECCVASVVTPYNQRSLDNGCVGSKVEDVFLPDNCMNLLQPSDIGCDLNMIYECSNGRAYLIDVQVI